LLTAETGRRGILSPIHALLLSDEKTVERRLLAERRRAGCMCLSGWREQSMLDGILAGRLALDNA